MHKLLQDLRMPFALALRTRLCVFAIVHWPRIDRALNLYGREAHCCAGAL